MTQIPTKITTQEIVAAIQKQARILETLERHLKNEYRYFGTSLDELKPSTTDPEFLVLLGAFLALENVLGFDKTCFFERYCLNNEIPEALSKLLTKHFGSSDLQS